MGKEKMGQKKRAKGNYNPPFIQKSSKPSI
jgi:hypothetical protein